METDLTKLVIDRRKWYRGRGYVGSYLLNAEGQMCCLGFRAIQCGYSEIEINTVRTPASVIELYPCRPGFSELINNIVGENSALSDEAMVINDSEKINDAEREAQLTELFAKHGIAITFEN